MYKRQLKELERRGLVKLCRGKETVVLAKPYEYFLDSCVFKKRARAIADLSKSLQLITPSICFHGLYHCKSPYWEDGGKIPAAKRLYWLFDRILCHLGNQTIMSLFYDVGAFAESSFLDMIDFSYGKEKSELFLNSILEMCIRDRSSEERY